MARKVVSRQNLRAEAEAAEAMEAAAPKKKVAKKTTTKKKTTRSKAAAEVRLKAFWGVFNQTMRRVAVFEFGDRKEADKKADDLTKSGKSPHFVQLVKEQIVE